MAKRKSVRELFFRKLFQELEKEYAAGNVSLAYARRILKKYGLDLHKIAKAHAMAQRSMYRKEERIYAKKKKNPPVALIYDNIEAIEAQKGHNSLWPKEHFKHDFKKGSKAIILGLPDGSLLIKSLNGKRLWKSFRYDDEIDGTRNE